MVTPAEDVVAQVSVRLTRERAVRRPLFLRDDGRDSHSGKTPVDLRGGASGARL